MSQVIRDSESRNGWPFNLAPANPALKGFRSWHSLNCLFKVGICEQCVSCPAAAQVAGCFHSSFSLISFLFFFLFLQGWGGVGGGRVGALWVILVRFPLRCSSSLSLPELADTESSYCWAQADSWPPRHFLLFHCGFVVCQSASEINNVFWPSATSHYHKGEVTHMNSRKPCRVTV